VCYFLGRCSLIGLLVVMSVVVVLVLLLISFPVDGVGLGGVPVHLFFVVCYCFLQDAAERTPLFKKQINSKPKKIWQKFFIYGKHIECRFRSMCFE